MTKSPLPTPLVLTQNKKATHPWIGLGLGSQLTPSKTASPLFFFLATLAWTRAMPVFKQKLNSGHFLAKSHRHELFQMFQHNGMQSTQACSWQVSQKLKCSWLYSQGGQGCKENHFYSLPFGQAEASINLLAQTSFQLAPKTFWLAELISQLFCYSKSSKNITRPLGKWKTEFTSPIAKSTCPGLLDTTFFACWWALLNTAFE